MNKRRFNNNGNYSRLTVIFGHHKMVVNKNKIWVLVFNETTGQQ